MGDRRETRLGVVIGHGRFAGTGAEREFLRRADVVVAADGGALYALEMGRVPEVVVGDFDSVTEATLRAKAGAFGNSGMRVVRVPCAKDETDLELALDEAVRLGCGEVVLLGALGGRLDHALANLQLLSAAADCGVKAWVLDGDQQVYLLRGEDRPGPWGEESVGELELSGRPGQYVSLLPLTPVAGPVWTEGLKYPLVGEDLRFGRSRGVSNEFMGGRAAVRLGRGALLVVVPGAAARVGDGGETNGGGGE